MGDEQTVALNRRARHDFTIDETFEAGIVLTGTEIKSIRMGKAKLELGLARGKQLHDRRRDIADRDARRDVAREMADAQRGR